MATILLTWELGLGIGHLMNLRPIGQELVRRGHKVVAAVRELSRVQELLVGTGISWMLAPALKVQGKVPYENVTGYAHMMGNMGFGDSTVLPTMFAAWSTLFDCVKPDLVIADHSPMALLALRGRPIRRVNIGLAFFCPPDRFPMPCWGPPGEAASLYPKMAAVEQQLVNKVNGLLSAHKRPLLERLSQVFNEIDDVILATYREFDHFGERPGMRYWGHWPFGIGVAPVWPAGRGPKIYSYLNPSPELENLLQILKNSKHPTIVLPAGIPAEIQARFSCSTLRFEQQPLDLHKVCGECDMAVTNAGHGAVATLLLAGRPCFLLPISMEQLMLARAMERTGAVCIAPSENKDDLQAACDEFFRASKFSDAAQVFAARYRGFVPGQQIPELVDHLEKLIKPNRLQVSWRKSPF